MLCAHFTRRIHLVLKTKAQLCKRGGGCVFLFLREAWTNSTWTCGLFSSQCLLTTTKLKRLETPVSPSHSIYTIGKGRFACSSRLGNTSSKWRTMSSIIIQHFITSFVIQDYPSPSIFHFRLIRQTKAGSSASYQLPIIKKGRCEKENHHRRENKL